MLHSYCLIRHSGPGYDYSCCLTTCGLINQAQWALDSILVFDLVSWLHTRRPVFHRGSFQMVTYVIEYTESMWSLHGPIIISRFTWHLFMPKGFR